MSARCGAVVALLVALVSAAAAAPRAPLVAAHRGGAALWPENSVTAFRGALALGVDALEFDLHLTADGEAVVIHDATLERTTTGQGRVASTTLAELRTLRLRDRAGAPTADGVPTLAEVLALVAGTPVALLPEIKLDAERRPYPGIEQQLVAGLRAHGLAARASVQSFDEATLRRVRALEPSARTMLLIGRGRMSAAAASAADVVRWAVDAGATDVGLDHRLIDAPLLAAAGAAGLRVAAWTVNTEADLRRVGELGVALVMTDHPGLARRLLVKP